MFTGTYRHAVDAKGRLFIPTKLREELGETFMLTRGLQNCLRLYPVQEWEVFAAKIAALPESKARDIRHYFYANTFEISPDAQGRITLPADSRRFAGLTKNVVLVGDNTRLEIWDEDSWDRHNRSNYDEVLQTLEALGF